MGYTHYWAQTGTFTADEWADVMRDLGAILSCVSEKHGVRLAGALGKRGSRPEISPERIAFNGMGPKNDHETFHIAPAGSDEFCKTARKPYDLAVTACLCYLSSVTGKFKVTSDGRGDNFLAGLEVAKEALPNLVNMLDLPMAVMQRDRWVGPYISGYGDSGYEVNFCIDGRGYVMQKTDGACCVFDTHRDLALFLDAHKEAKFRTGGKVNFGHCTLTYDKVEPDIWSATGSFDGARHDRIAKAQAKVLKTLFPVAPGRSSQPPAFVRPGQYDRDAFNAYYLRDLLNPKVEAA